MYAFYMLRGYPDNPPNETDGKLQLMVVYRIDEGQSSMAIFSVTRGRCKELGFCGLIFSNI